MAITNSTNLRNTYHIVVTLPNNSQRTFDNCTYVMGSNNSLHITNVEGFPITFVGNFCAEIVLMEDFNKIRK